MVVGALRDAAGKDRFSRKRRVDVIGIVTASGFVESDHPQHPPHETWIFETLAETPFRPSVSEFDSGLVPIVILVRYIQGIISQISGRDIAIEGRSFDDIGAPPGIVLNIRET